MRKIQSNRKGHSFIIATFTATAIYQGVEDMYNETIAALHLREPITYLGYVKRGDIEIKIDKTPFDKGERAEFDLEKFSDIENAIKRAKFFRKKTLIYFPEVQLIETAKIILQNRNNLETVATYHGKLNRDDKRENYEKFFRGDKLVMLSTKAFGMGIDINDIEIVIHYAPTGNVCDYVQEIGRAARRNDLRGEALYHYDKRDFKYIKRLHGLSAIKKYQLIAVVKKIYELWSFKRKNNLLLDAENFTYIFDRYADESTSINKVKTALLIIQKDFEARLGFSPLTVRPIPLFSVGFFVINPSVQKNLLNDLDSYRKIFNRKGHSIFAAKTYPDGRVHYLFNAAMRFYFAWVEKTFNRIFDETRDGKFYIADATTTRAKEINTVLGILEALGVLNFKMTGGRSPSVITFRSRCSPTFTKTILITRRFGICWKIIF